MVDSNLSELPSDSIRAAVRSTVEKLLTSKKYAISVTSASQSGDNNFIGIVYRVLFNGVNDQNENNQSKLILKVAPQNVARRMQFFSRPCFLREIYMYNEVLPYFRQFEQSKGVISDENGFNEYPKCYHTIADEPHESVLLEDLSVRSFSMIDRFTEEVSADHVRLVMRCLGKLHAISFAIKDQQPTKFDELASPLNEIFIRKDDKNLCDYFAKQSEAIIKVVSDAEDAHLLVKVKKLFERTPMEIAAECVDSESAGSAAIITHGDMWQNNTMFRYNSDGKPIETVLLDWQISRCSSPIIDIVYFVFCCTTKEVRDGHYDEFLKVYHNSLSNHIRRLGSDPDKLFSYDLMLEHFHKFAHFGLILSSALLPMLTADGSNGGIDLDKISDDVKNGAKLDANVFISRKSLTKLNKRLRDVVVDLARLKYI